MTKQIERIQGQGQGVPINISHPPDMSRRGTFTERVPVTREVMKRAMAERQSPSYQGLSVGAEEREITDEQEEFEIPQQEMIEIDREPGKVNTLKRTIAPVINLKRRASNLKARTLSPEARHNKNLHKAKVGKAVTAEAIREQARYDEQNRGLNDVCTAARNIYLTETSSSFGVGAPWELAKRRTNIHNEGELTDHQADAAQAMMVMVPGLVDQRRVRSLHDRAVRGGEYNRMETLQAELYVAEASKRAAIQAERKWLVEFLGRDGLETIKEELKRKMSPVDPKESLKDCPRIFETDTGDDPVLIARSVGRIVRTDGRNRELLSRPDDKEDHQVRSDLAQWALRYHTLQEDAVLLDNTWGVPTGEELVRIDPDAYKKNSLFRDCNLGSVDQFHDRALRAQEQLMDLVSVRFPPDQLPGFRYLPGKVQEWSADNHLGMDFLDARHMADEQEKFVGEVAERKIKLDTDLHDFFFKLQRTETSGKLDSNVVIDRILGIASDDSDPHQELALGALRIIKGHMAGNSVATERVRWTHTALTAPDAGGVVDEGEYNKTLVKEILNPETKRSLALAAITPPDAIKNAYARSGVGSGGLMSDVLLAATCADDTEFQQIFTKALEAEFLVDAKEAGVEKTVYPKCGPAIASAETLLSGSYSPQDRILLELAMNSRDVATQVGANLLTISAEAAGTKESNEYIIDMGEFASATYETHTPLYPDDGRLSQAYIEGTADLLARQFNKDIKRNGGNETPNSNGDDQVFDEHVSSGSEAVLNGLLKTLPPRSAARLFEEMGARTVDGLKTSQQKLDAIVKLASVTDPSVVKKNAAVPEAANRWNKTAGEMVERLLTEITTHPKEYLFADFDEEQRGVNPETVEDHLSALSTLIQTFPSGGDELLVGTEQQGGRGSMVQRVRIRAIDGKALENDVPSQYFVDTVDMNSVNGTVNSGQKLTSEAENIGLPVRDYTTREQVFAVVARKILSDGATRPVLEAEEGFSQAVADFDKAYLTSRMASQRAESETTDVTPEMIADSDIAAEDLTKSGSDKEEAADVRRKTVKNFPRAVLVCQRLAADLGYRLTNITPPKGVQENRVKYEESVIQIEFNTERHPAMKRLDQAASLMNNADAYDLLRYWQKSDDPLLRNLVDHALKSAQKS